MIYKIVVDKQPKENPSEEKRIYEIDIEELRMKGDVYDSLVITYDEDYIMRRLSLNEYMALNVLDTPIKEPLENINIELFEGDNYIYIIDVTGEKLYAEYLVENKFNQLYVTKSEMTSAINQSANAIELRVDGKITRVDGEIQEINAGLELKVDKNDNDQVVSMINASADEITLNSNRLIINSTNFKLNSAGNITCTGGTIGGFTIGSTNFNVAVSGLYDYNSYDLSACTGCIMDWLYTDTILSDVLDATSDGKLDSADFVHILKHIRGIKSTTKNVSGTFKINSTNPKNCLSIQKDGNTVVSLGVGGVNTNLLTTQNILCGLNTGTTINSFTGVSINGSEGKIYCIQGGRIPYRN